mgnify:FL=1
MDRIGFLLNHYDAHQVPHIVPYAFKLSQLYSEIEVTILTSTTEQKEFAKEIGARFPKHTCNFVDINASLAFELMDPLLSQFIFMRKSAVLRKNIKLLSDFDSLVVPEVTSLSLKKHNSFVKTKLVFTGHGAGDNQNIGSFDSRLSEFSLCLLPGKKYAEGLRKRGFVTTENYAIAGYPKFEAVVPTNERKALFENKNPVIIYNPHHHPDYSSWPVLGERILDFFYTNKNYNLIFAPHVLLFKRKWGKGFKLPRKYTNLDNIIIDEGSRRSIDMSYMNAADIYFGDCSSQVYEYLLKPRPCVFFDTLAREPNSEHPYSCWNFGLVTKTTDDLEGTIISALESHDKFSSIQREAFKHTFETTETSPSERGAHIIAEFTRKGTIDKKWQ